MSNWFGVKTLKLIEFQSVTARKYIKKVKTEKCQINVGEKLKNVKLMWVKWKYQINVGEKLKMSN